MAPGINRLKTWVLIAADGRPVRPDRLLLGPRAARRSPRIRRGDLQLREYWFSDKIAIKTTRSQPVTEREMPDYYRIVRQLATEQNMPMPKLFVSEMMQPNAFATGRNPEHASVVGDPGHPADPRRA